MSRLDFSPLRADLAALLRSRVKEASHIDLVGDRPLNKRWAAGVVGVVALAGMMGVSLHLTAAVGRQMAHDPFENTPPQVQIPAPYTEVLPPDTPYRVEVTSLKDARTVTTVHMDPKQWSDLEQRTFLRKLVSQADQRAVQTKEVYEVHAYAPTGAAQMQAQRFLRQAIQDAGITAQPPDWSKDGTSLQDPQSVGLRFAWDDSAQSLDRLGADPCFVNTGDAVGCIRKDADQQVASTAPRRRRSP